MHNVSIKIKGKECIERKLKQKKASLCRPAKVVKMHLSSGNLTFAAAVQKAYNKMESNKNIAIGLNEIHEMALTLVI